MRTAICEDEKFYSDRLSAYVEEYFGKRGESGKISVFTDGAPLLEALGNGAVFDIIFLDIQLEASDGVEVARQIRELDRNVAIVFVTGLEERVFDGYEVAALDYVVKTDLEERLFRALDRFMEQRGARALAVQLAGGGTAVVQYADVLWLESEGRGTLIGTEKEQIHSPLPVGQLAGLLPVELFVEVHKSVYVRTGAIRRLGADTVEMRDGSLLPLSRRRRKAVMSAVMDTVKG